MPSWAEFLELARSFGLTEGVFAVFFFMMHGWFFYLYRGRIKDRQGEINRLAAENREYRDRFNRLLDRHYDITDNKPEV